MVRVRTLLITLAALGPLACSAPPAPRSPSVAPVPLGAPAPDAPPLELVESVPVETTLAHPSLRKAADVWLEMVGRARRTLDLAQFYASDAPGSRLEPVVAAIEAAVAGGVRVRFLVEASFVKVYPETLARLTALAQKYQPKTIVCLGDNFHDSGGPSRLDDEARGALRALMRGRRFVWIEGNHDAGSALVLGGECTPELAIGALRFRHEPVQGPAPGELAGHLHPAATVETRVKRLRRRCFVGDGTRCVLPAFGSYTGGLDVFEPAFAPLFPNGFQAYLLGRDRVYPFAHSKLAA